ncbi:MAG: TIGR03761 family integrating conjugative element protein [Candidatus Thiodiazotropha lotti]|uniref:TIGR03761 family integrating conjugative element protein n=1 Tax=Candidatus Thiodiazotropha lotti TaxID=2792787 RepID=A0A9E4K1V9_9GAMM|nr:TIGR03761 family integrating conjugative element protein [Candidatus Thiodiazotropha lotti]MCW4201945.1 TIGR03761 family integrating conjugative element protein [Candidatus Thiodiazotropha lotti]
MEQEAKQSELDDIVVIDETNILESEMEDDPQILDEVDNSITTTHRIDAGSEKREKNSSPGRLKTKGSVVIHTRSAHDLFYGRRGDRESGVNQIVGLTLFATNANNLSLLCKRDDPYAEAALIKIENLLDDIQRDLSNKIAHLNSILDNMGGVTIDFHESEDPITIPLEFGTPYGYIATRCLSQYDKLVTLAYSAKQAGLIVQSDWHRYVIRTRTKLRRIFHLSNLYRFGGATRDDIAANNAVARAVSEKYGVLSPKILEKELRAQFVSHNRT